MKYKKECLGCPFFGFYHEEGDSYADCSYGYPVTEGSVKCDKEE